MGFVYLGIAICFFYILIAIFGDFSTTTTKDGFVYKSNQEERDKTMKERQEIVIILSVIALVLLAIAILNSYPTLILWIIGLGVAWWVFSISS